MLVKDLIKELKKLPKDAEVYIQDHDHDKYEYNGELSYVELVDFDDIDPWDKVSDELTLSGKIVMLHG